jgi:sialic acid synthase SpsE
MRLTMDEFVGYPVGSGRCLVIAEIGINHNGDLMTALALQNEAFKAGADLVKYQVRTPEICVPSPDDKQRTRKRWQAR